MILFKAMHHTAAVLLVIPLNIFYPRNWYFHMLCCLGNYTHFTFPFIAEYGKTLNLDKKLDLLFFNVFNVLMVIQWIFGRIVIFIWIAL